MNRPSAASRFGKLALIVENDGCQWSLKVYLTHYLHHQLSANWVVDVLAVNCGRPLSPWLEQCAPRVFDGQAGPAAVPFLNASTLIQDAHAFAGEIWKASPLYFHLRESSYDGFVFIGLTPSLGSLLPLTRGRNCVIPLLHPAEKHDFINHVSLRHGLLGCEYYYCHSEKEAAILRMLQPHAEIRALPLPVDLDFALRFLPNDPKHELEPGSVLLVAEEEDASVKHFRELFAEKSIPVVLALDRVEESGSADGVRRMPLLQLVYRFEEVMEAARAVLLFQGENFLPLFYNMCQSGALIFVSGNHAWGELLDGDGVYPLSFEKVPDLAAEPLSHRCIPVGYHHYRYFNNYLLRFINEWSVDNLIRVARSS